MGSILFEKAGHMMMLKHTAQGNLHSTHLLLDIQGRGKIYL